MRKAIQKHRQCICTGKPYRAYPWHPPVFLLTIRCLCRERVCEIFLPHHSAWDALPDRPFCDTCILVPCTRKLPRFVPPREGGTLA